MMLLGDQTAHCKQSRRLACRQSMLRVWHRREQMTCQVANSKSLQQMILLAEAHMFSWAIAPMCIASGASLSGRINLGSIPKLPTWYM